MLLPAIPDLRELCLANPWLQTIKDCPEAKLQHSQKFPRLMHHY